MGYFADFPFYQSPGIFYLSAGRSGVREAQLNKGFVYDTAWEQVITHVKSFFYL